MEAPRVNTNDKNYFRPVGAREDGFCSKKRMDITLLTIGIITAVGSLFLITSGSITGSPHLIGAGVVSGLISLVAFSLLFGCGSPSTSFHIHHHGSNPPLWFRVRTVFVRVVRAPFSWIPRRGKLNVPGSRGNGPTFSTVPVEINSNRPFHTGAGSVPESVINNTVHHPGNRFQNQFLDTTQSGRNSPPLPRATYHTTVVHPHHPQKTQNPPPPPASGGTFATSNWGNGRGSSPQRTQVPPPPANRGTSATSNWGGGRGGPKIPGSRS